MRCPECGDEMVKEYGASADRIINVLRSGSSDRRVARPVVFWSCYTCGHCQEHGVPALPAGGGE